MGYHVVGVDYSTEMVRLARAEGVLDVRLMDIRDLDFHEATFAGVWANASLHHLSNRDLRAALAEFWRVLEPGGVLFISVKRGQSGHVVNEDYQGCPRHYVYRWVEDLRPVLEDIGFCEYESNTVPGGTVPPEWVYIYAIKPRCQQLMLPFGCRMCHIIGRLSGVYDRRDTSSPLCDQPILAMSQCVVFPALGQIVEGYLLAVSLEHVPCFGALSAQRWGEINNLKRVLREMLEAQFGPVVFFEHGSVSPFHLTGSSVVHAHLHACPAPKEFLKSVAKVVAFVQVDAGKFARECFASARGYLLIEDHGGVSWGCTPPAGLPSQFLRRHLARSTGCTGKWDWASYPHTEQVALTIRRLGAMKG
jgi:diadenosine tetraphosphate (Ap4A) HIT family hydrolase